MVSPIWMRTGSDKDRACRKGRMAGLQRLSTDTAGEKGASDPARITACPRKPREKYIVLIANHA